MAECTNVDLKNARNAAKLPRWQAAQRLGVSEETVRRWESGETRPEPDDVWAMEKAYNADGLWHRWMRSTYDSYRDNWPETVNHTLPLAVVDVRHQMNDVMALQDTIERDAMDGKIDNTAAAREWLKEAKELQAALAEAVAKLERKG